VHRVITRHLLDQVGFKADEADSGTVTLIQLFGSAAKLNILNCGLLDAAYRCTDGGPAFVEADSPTDEELQAPLHKVINRLMKLLTRRGVLVEDDEEEEEEEEEEGDQAIWPTLTAIWMMPARSSGFRPQPALTALPLARAPGKWCFKRQDALARRHHAPRDVAAGVDAAPGCAGATGAAAPDRFYGMLAPNAKLRELVVRAGQGQGGVGAWRL